MTELERDAPRCGSTCPSNSPARRAARVLETAVGEALGPVEQTYPGKKGLLAGKAFSEKDRSYFRLMAAHRDLWWPVLAEKALSRRQVLTMIAEANANPGAHLDERPK